VTGRPAVSNGGGSFLPAFITAYPAVLVPSFRADLLWRQHTDNVVLSHAAWTDDNSPRWYTVFAAGVSPSGYTADSITNSTDRVTSFPALHALAGTPRFCGTLAVPAWVLTTAEASAGYNAYRRGQRQTFKTGASFLNRRSSVQPAFNPGDAGLPDVVMGALGLAELLMPGVLAQSTATEYGRCPGCLADVASDSLDTVSNPNGSVGSEDLDAFIAAFIASSGAVADVASDSLDTTYNPNGSVGAEDLDAFISSFIAGC